MKKITPLLLRTASILMLIHLIGHTIGHSGWRKATDPAVRPVIAEMTGPKFPFMGAVRSMGDFYDGYGYACSIAMLLFVVLLWLIGGDEAGGSDSSDSSGSPLGRRLTLVVAVALLVWGIDELIFFFLFAACTTLLACLCCFIAFALMGSRSGDAGYRSL